MASVICSRAWRSGSGRCQRRWVPRRTWRRSSNCSRGFPIRESSGRVGIASRSILFLCLCGVVCGANDLVSIERFGNSRREFLERFVEFPSGIPSHDTIGRVLAKLDPEPLEDLFARWMRGVATATQEGVIAIDGKALRRAFDKANGGTFVTMVSAWSTANGVVLGQVGTAEGSNEIEAFPRLLDCFMSRAACDSEALAVCLRRARKHDTAGDTPSHRKQGVAVADCLDDDWGLFNMRRTLPHSLSRLR